MSVLFSVGGKKKMLFFSLWILFYLSWLSLLSARQNLESPGGGHAIKDLPLSGYGHGCEKLSRLTIDDQ